MKSCANVLSYVILAQPIKMAEDPKLRRRTGEDASADEEASRGECSSAFKDASH